MSIQKIDGQTTEGNAASPLDPKQTLSYDADGNARVLIGYQEDGFGTKDFGIKVSQDGYDVRTATDDQLVMSSAFNSFKIVATGTASATIVGGNDANKLVTVLAHNLGFTPIVHGFFDNGFSQKVMFPDSPGARERLSGGAGSSIVGMSNPIVWICADETNLYLYMWANALGNSPNPTMSTKTYDIRYYLLRETAV